MNIGQLEYLVKTIKAGSYASAAKQLYVTPQAISKSIGELEKELCIRLLEKSGRGVCPTRFAVSFSAQAEEVLRAFADLRAFAKSQSMAVSQSGAVSLAVTAINHRSELFQKTDFDQFNTIYPNVSLKLFFFPSESCLSAFRERIVEAALILGDYNDQDTQSHRLFSFDLALSVSSKHELSNRTEVSMRDLTSYRFAMPQDSRCVFAAIKKKFEHYGELPEFECVAPYKDAVEDFIECGGIVFTAGSEQLSGISIDTKCIKFSQSDRIQISTYLIYRDTQEPSPLPLLSNYLRRAMKKKNI